ncbi:MAG: hypothetical protein EOO90_18755 [Pedobacter sp.]|nr:MAG: hypothetical protein EOO90_18755 [Pedobacter sp.]
MLHEKLKAETAQAHNDLEQAMFVNDIMKKTLTQDQYQDLLAANYLTHLFYERAIFKALSPQIADQLDLTSRDKIAALEEDIEQAGLQQSSLQTLISESIEPIQDSAFALGAMYVLEGATLGGSVIVKQLKLNPNFKETQTFGYYGCYGDKLIPNWQQFLSVLNALPEDQHKQALAGALFMFNEIARITNIVKLERFQLS